MEEEIDLGFDFDSDALSGAVGATVAPEPAAPQPEPEPTVDIEVDHDPDLVATGVVEPVRAPVGAELIDHAEEQPDGAESLELVRTFERAESTEVDPGLAEVAAAIRGPGSPESDEAGADAPETADATTPTVEAEAESQPEGGGMDLLDEILADSGFDVGRDQQSQVDTIAQEMQGQIGNSVAADDYPGQYEMGIVYMDMGLYEQAMLAFEVAMGGEEQRIPALEMKGTCMLRLERPADAMDVFREGLAIGGHSREAYIGLLYGVGVCHEMSGEFDEARDYYIRVTDVDENFLDVSERLERLSIEN